MCLNQVVETMIGTRIFVGGKWVEFSGMDWRKGKEGERDNVICYKHLMADMRCELHIFDLK